MALRSSRRRCRGHSDPAANRRAKEKRALGLAHLGLRPDADFFLGTGSVDRDLAGFRFFCPRRGTSAKDHLVFLRTTSTSLSRAWARRAHPPGFADAAVGCLMGRRAGASPEVRVAEENQKRNRAGHVDHSAKFNDCEHAGLLGFAANQRQPEFITSLSIESNRPTGPVPVHGPATAAGGMQGTGPWLGPAQAVALDNFPYQLTGISANIPSWLVCRLKRAVLAQPSPDLVPSLAFPTDRAVRSPFLFDPERRNGSVCIRPGD